MLYDPVSGVVAGVVAGLVAGLLGSEATEVVELAGKALDGT